MDSISPAEFPEVLGQSQELVVDFNKLPKISEFELFNFLTLKLLKFNSQLLNDAMCFFLIEEKQIKKQISWLKNFFFGGHGDKLDDCAKYLFNYQGELKVRNLFGFDEFFQSLEFPSTFFQLKFIAKEDDLSPSTLLTCNLKSKLQVSGHFASPFRLFFNDKILAIQLEIFEQLLVIRKVSNILNKNHRMVMKLHHFLPERIILNQFYYNIRLLKNFFELYEQYVFQYLIEGSFSKMLGKLDEAKSFNEFYKFYTKFLNVVYMELFQINRNPQFKKNLDYLVLISVTFYKNLRIIQAAQKIDQRAMHKTLSGVANSLKAKIEQMTKTINDSYANNFSLQF